MSEAADIFEDAGCYVLRVKDWWKYFENNRTRELRRMDWVPIPTKQDGDGYTELLEHEDGAAHFGAWIAIVELAAKCDPRGTLLRDVPAATPQEGAGCLRDGICSGKIPHTCESISRMTRVSVSCLKQAVPRLISIGWLERIRLEFQGFTKIPQEGAAQVRDDCDTVAGARAPAHARTAEHSIEQQQQSGRGIAAAAFEKRGICGTLPEWAMKFSQGEIDEACRRFDEAAARGTIRNPAGFMLKILADGCTPPKLRKPIPSVEEIQAANRKAREASERAAEAYNQQRFGGGTQ